MKATRTGHGAASFKARDYVFRKPTMAQAFLDRFPNMRLNVPHVREPKLAKDGMVISADFKRLQTDKADFKRG